MSASQILIWMQIFMGACENADYYSVDSAFLKIQLMLMLLVCEPTFWVAVL